MFCALCMCKKYERERERKVGARKDKKKLNYNTYFISQNQSRDLLIAHEKHTRMRILQAAEAINNTYN